ncbi:tRNA (adenine(22)-N(1))-methyltransferase TrmK [Reinekea sp.]|jgi:tRNA (adenine22-N1)-methyltransferase|uniref:tRNA (adenine(22)-N(1))-methyltransferase TrmK n=1 Tax=Reinekea sp. TaxID=1970455 RepID=UPI003989473A
MTQTPLKTKLGKRLKHLLAAIPQNSQIVWDLCCDHGALGRAIIESRTETGVVFNDIHPDIMARLSEQLIRLQAKNYEIVIAPAETIELKNIENQTVVLAGVGDEQCITIMQALSQQKYATNCRFIISPTTKVALVRRYLIDAGYFLLEESVVTENKRTYEVLTVSTSARFGGTKMSDDNGDDIGQCWQPTTDHIQHLNKLIGYYQGQTINVTKPYAKSLLCQYQVILKSIA